MKRIASFLIISILTLSQGLYAQCAMCKAVVEGQAQEGIEIVDGVNNGILYMMGVPYILMMVVGFAWYKKYGKPTQEKEI